MQRLEELLELAADTLWGSWMLFALIGVGMLYTAMTGFVQIRQIPRIWREVSLKNTKSTETALSPLQSLMISLASIIGSGNIVGVCTAIISGGPGAMFWMWFSAFVGMATKYGEIILGICHRGYDSNGMRMGGPMYYISAGLKAPWLGGLVAVLLFIQNASGTLIQTNTIVNVVYTGFSVPFAVTGAALAAVMLYIALGGLKRLAAVAQRLAPFMSVFFIVGGITIILINIANVPAMLADIFKGAFTLKAGAGAAAGIGMRQAMRYGVARGLYSNEAGEGSAAVLHSCVEVDHPARQGMYGIADVFVDTIVVCTITGFAVLSSGVAGPDSNAATLAADAFGSVLPALRYVIYISLFLFASSSLMSQWYFGNVSLSYLGGTKLTVLYKFVFPITIIIGSLVSSNMVWVIQDCALGILIIPNLVALTVMSPKVRRLTKEFFGRACNPKND